MNSTSILNALSMPAFVIDIDHVVVAWNAPCELLTGVASADILGTRGHWKAFYDKPRPCLADLVLDNLLSEASKFYSLHEKTQFASDGYHAEGWFDKLGGKRRYLSFEAKPLFESDRVTGAVEILQDLTRHQEALDQLKLSASVFENTSEGIMITSADNRIISANRALEKLTGHTVGDIIGKNPKLFASDRHPGSFFADMWNTLDDLGHWQGEIWNRRKNGEEYLVRSYISTVRTGDNETNYIALMTDITEQNRVMDKMEHLAHHDFLTGLPNRTLLEDRMHQALIRAERNKSKFALMFLDLDRFKRINDTLGHHIGDLLLKEVTRRIQSCLRAVDTVSRHGGDEFVLLLEEFNEDGDISHTARKILDYIATPCHLEGHEVNVTSSIGLSLYPMHGATVPDLLIKADIAMYQAKNQGRNNFQFFAEASDSDAARAAGD